MSRARVLVRGGSRRRIAPLCLCLALAGCGASDDHAVAAATDAGAIPEGDAHFTLALGGATEPAGRLAGWNLGRGTYYAPEGDPHHPEWRTAERTATLAKLRDVRMPGGPKPYVRFSGLQIDGAIGADGYHFWDFVRPDRGVASTDNLSVPELDAIVREIDGEPTITLNFGSGTAAEAAQYAAYLSGTDPANPMVAARLASGHPEPYGVTVFEIGNESYGAWNTGASATGQYSYANPAAKNGGDPAWAGRPSSSAADYAARALEYVHAVSAVVPGARFRVPLAQGSMDAWGGLDTALAALAPLLAEPAIDAVVVHLYAAEDGETLGVTDFNSDEYAVAGAELFRAGLVGLRARLDALPRATPLDVAITEYHVADGIVRDRYTRGDSAAVGLGLADLWILFAQLGVEHLCEHLSLSSDRSQDILVEPWYDPLRPGDAGVRERPGYTVTRLLVEHALARRATLTRVRSPVGSAAFVDAPVSFERVHAVAFASADGRSGTVTLLHRDLDHPLTLTLDVEDGVRVESVVAWSPVSPSTTEDVPVTDVPFRQVARRAELVAPPHSVVAVTLAR